MQRLSMNKDISKVHLSKLVFLFLCISVFAFPDIKELTYLSRVLAVISFVFEALANKSKVKNPFFFLWAFFMTAISIVNLCVSIDMQLTLSIVITMLTGMWAAFSMFEFVKTYEDMKCIYKYAIISTTILCLRLFLYLDFGTWGQRKVGTMLGMNVNSIGLRLALILILLVHLFCRTRGKKRLVSFSLICVHLAMILVTGSRRALILATLSIVIFAFGNSKNPIKLFRTLILCIVSGVILWGILTQTPQFRAVIGERLEHFVFGLFQGNSSAFDDGRDLMTLTALELFTQRPIFGWGLGCFSVNSGFDIAYSHNNYAELLYATGSIGFVVYYSYHLKTLHNLRMLKNKRQDYLLCISIIICLLVSDFAAVNATTMVTHVFIGILLTYLRKDMVSQANVN